MTSLLGINDFHLSCLDPLLKWRVMDINSLREECFRKLNSKNFYRIIAKLEGAKLIESYKNPFNRRKYVYLSTEGQKELSTSDNPFSITKENLIHDLKLTEILRLFQSEGWINEVELDHQILESRKKGVRAGLIPDAIIRGRKGKNDFSIAFELELTQKSRARIIEKISDYFSSPQYDYVLYFFCNERVLIKYKEVVNEKFQKEYTDRVMFFHFTDQKIKEWKGYFKDRKITLSELFTIE